MFKILFNDTHFINIGQEMKSREFFKDCPFSLDTLYVTNYASVTAIKRSRNYR